MSRVARHLLAAAAAAAAASTPYVRITTTGATFAPVIEGPTGTVTWTVEETGTNATGLTPTINFGSAATRHVRMAVSGGDGLADVVTLNLGYNHTDDASAFSPAASYDHAAQAVSALTGLTLLTGLELFMASSTSLAGTVDLTGLASLTNVECFEADVEAVTLIGCTSLQRLCVEGCNLATLDLNPVAANLIDLRAAIQQSGALTLTALTADLAVLYHLCLRNQIMTGMPVMSRLPHVVELWIWGTGYTGGLTPASDALVSLMTGYNPALTTLDLTGQMPAGRNGIVQLPGCAGLTAVTLDVGAGNVDLSGCTSLDQADVDGILTTLAGGVQSNGSLNLSDTSAPSAAGVADALTLTGRGWTVTLDSAGAGVLADAFTRANTTSGLGSGADQVGNGWVGTAGVVANIVGNALVNQSAGGAYRVIHNPGQGLLPVDYTVRWTVPHAVLTGQTYWGVVGKYNPADGTGVRLLFSTSSTAYLVGNATGPFDADITLQPDATLPASWSADQDHTVALKIAGSVASVILDGVQVAHGPTTVNQTMTGTAYGTCGDNTASWLAVAVIAP